MASQVLFFGKFFHVNRNFKSIFSLVLLFVTHNITPNTAEESIAFDQFLSLFEDCTVKFFNLGETQLTTGGDYVPASRYTSKNPVLEPGKRSLWNFGLRTNCLAVFYIWPAWIQPQRDKEDGKSRWDDYPYSRMKAIDTETSRFDILVNEENGNETMGMWIAKYKNKLFDKGISSHALVVTIDKNGVGFAIQDKLEIVNKLQLAMGNMVTASYKISDILMDSSGRSKLERIIEDVQDARKNGDIPWTMDNLVASQFSSPRGNIDHRLASIALGDNVTLVINEERYITARKRKVMGPTIIFRVPGGQMMIDPNPRRMGFLTCNVAGGYTTTFYKPGLYQVIKEFLSIFETRVHVLIIVAYLGPCIILGCLYHFWLKKKLQKKYWIKWHAFTWGLRALVSQAGDRRLNSSRFGFMIWVVGPLLLGAVVISFSFKGRNIGLLDQGTRVIRERVTLGSLNRKGVLMVTDIEQLERAGFMFIQSVHGSKGITHLLTTNKSTAYVTWWDRIEPVAMRIGMYATEGTVCGRWGTMLTKAEIEDDYYSLSSFSWWAQSALRRKVWYGWEIERCGDYRFMRRLKWMDGPSGLVAKFRSMMKREDFGGMGWDYYPWVSSISMHSNMAYVYGLGLFVFVVAFVIWVVEQILYRIWTKPRRRRRKAARMRERDGGGDVFVVETGNFGEGDLNREFEVVEEEIEKDGVAEAISLAEEEQKSMTSVAEDEEHRVQVEVKIHMNGQMENDDSDMEGDIVEEVINMDKESEQVGGLERDEGGNSVTEILDNLVDDKESALGSDLDSVKEESDYENSRHEDGGSDGGGERGKGAENAESIVAAVETKKNCFADDYEAVLLPGTILENDENSVDKTVGS